MEREAHKYPDFKKKYYKSLFSSSGILGIQITDPTDYWHRSCRHSPISQVSHVSEWLGVELGEPEQSILLWFFSSVKCKHSKSAISDGYFFMSNCIPEETSLQMHFKY